mgnify:CR=1 FL=1
MKVIVTEPALADLEDIRSYLVEKYPRVIAPLRKELLSIFRRLQTFPQAAPLIRGRSDVHCILLAKYPYKIFYKVGKDFVEILHVYHTARNV